VVQVTVISSPVVHLPRPFTLTALRLYPQSWPPPPPPPPGDAHDRRPVLPYPVFVACGAPPVSAARDLVAGPADAPELVPVSRHDAWNAVLAAVFADNHPHF